MNIDLHYYTSCYRMAAYLTVLNEDFVNEIPITEDLDAKTYWFYSEDDISVGDVSQFIVEFYRKKRLIDRIIFNTDHKRGAKFDKKLYKDDILSKISLVERLEPSIPVKLLQHKPNLTKDEREMVSSITNELASKIDIIKQTKVIPKQNKLHL